MQFKEICSKISGFLVAVTKILAAYLEQSLTQIDKKWWDVLVLENLSEDQRRQVINQKIRSLQELDLAALLRIFLKNWYKLSKIKNLPHNGQQLVKNIQEVRNRWAHVPAMEITKENTFQDLEIIIKFLLMFNSGTKLIDEITNLKNIIISPNRKFITGYDRKRVERLCNELVNGTRGIELGREILKQLNQGYLTTATYNKLSRWVNPFKPEYSAQPIAEEISIILFAEKIERINE